MRDRNAPLTPTDLEALDWTKMDGLLPAVVQDRRSGRVLMLGYMNREALEHSLAYGRVTFWSRSRRQLWTKGETSGHFLQLGSIQIDCDGDALLLLVDPAGPTCHLGTSSCFGDAQLSGAPWLERLAEIVADRASGDDRPSYTRQLLGEGSARIAQKIGEEGVEVALAAVGSSDQACASEIADLLYHLTVLMEHRKMGWPDVIALLQARHEASGG